MTSISIARTDVEANPAKSTAENGRILDLRTALLLAFVVVVLIVPRSIIDYGESGDAWDNAGDAIKLGTEGLIPAIPHMIRWPPGVPLFIYALAPVAPMAGHVGTNLLVAAFYIAAVALFAVAVRDEQHGRLLTVLFALTPIVIKNAAVTQDFVCGLVPVLAAYIALQRGRYALAGLLIGVAAGFRITNILFVIPASAYMVLTPIMRDRWARIAGLSALAAAVALCCYSPFILTSGLGWRYFMPLPGHGNKQPILVHVRLAVYNWVYVLGPAACVTLLSAGLMEGSRIVKAARLMAVNRAPIVAFGGLAIGLHGMLTWTFTMKAEYVLPALPFLYILLAGCLSRKAMVWFAIAASSYAVLSVETKGGSSGKRTLTVRPAWGLVVDDYVRRTEIAALRQGVGQLRSLGKAVVLTGMAGVLTADNPAVETSDIKSVSAGALPEWGVSEHRAVGSTVHRIRSSGVFLVDSLPKAGVDLVRRDGYKVYMFSEYAPTAAVNGQGYDPYTLDIQILPILSARAFYHGHSLD